MSESTESTPAVQAVPRKIEDLKDMADLVSLAKRRGFVFPSSEVYGGINACWDYGHFVMLRFARLNLLNARA